MAADKSARDELKALQAQLVSIQRVFALEGLSAVIVLQGWDAAGKGGLIRRIAWVLDPRHLSVWPIKAPNAVEQEELWLQRFWRRIPSAGEIAIFDRSWYGRVLVERVEAFCSETAWQRLSSRARVTTSSRMSARFTGRRDSGTCRKHVRMLFHSTC